MSDLNQNHSEADRDTRLEALFARALAIPVEAPAFLETRVLARRLFFWRAWALGLGAACCVVVSIAFFSSGHGIDLRAGVGTPHVVRVELENLDKALVANAEIVLPDGVFFYSESFPGIRDRRELKFAWADGKSPHNLPFVIKSDSPGVHLVRVLFRDGNGAVVGERVLKIEFSGEKS